MVNSNPIRALLMVVAIFLLASAAFQRNSIWFTKLSLWTDVASKTPGKSRVHNSLGNCYVLEGDYFRAVEEYKQSLALDKGNIEAYYNIAFNLEHIGLLQEALYYYNVFCKTAHPDYREATATACERVSQLSSELGTHDNK